MTRRLVATLALAVTLCLVTAPPAFAYIDPGSTNFLLQLVFGSLLGAGLAVATFWKRIRSFFGRLFARKQ